MEPQSTQMRVCTASLNWAIMHLPHYWYPESLKRQTHAVMVALVAAITSGSLPLLTAGTMAGHDEIIRRLALL